MLFTCSQFQRKYLWRAHLNTPTNEHTHTHTQQRCRVSWLCRRTLFAIRNRAHIGSQLRRPQFVSNFYHRSVRYGHAFLCVILFISFELAPSECPSSCVAICYLDTARERTHTQRQSNQMKLKIAFEIFSLVRHLLPQLVGMFVCISKHSITPCARVSSFRGGRTIHARVVVST